MGAPQNTGPSFIPASPTVEFSGSPSPCLFVVNGNLYVTLTTIGTGGGGINGTGVYKSTDGGNTWNQMDAAHAPKGAVGSAFYDVAGNQLICGLCPETFPGTLQSTFLKNFSFATDTWGANYATGGPSSSAAVWFTFKRPDGSILIFVNLSTSNPVGQSNLQAAYWNGAVWSANIDIGGGLVALQANGLTSGSDTAAVMDSNGNVSLAFDNNLRTIFMFQQLKANNTLGTFIQLSETFQNNLPPFGFMQILGSKIYLPAITDAAAHNTLFTFTPLVGPTKTSSVIAALTPPMNGVNFPGAITTDGTNLYWMVTWQDALFNNQFQIAKSADAGATWAFLPDNVTSSYFYSFTASTLAPHADPSFGISAVVLAFGTFQGNSLLFGATNVNNNTSFTQNGYFLNSEILAAAPPGSVANLKITLRGVKRRPAKPPEDLQEAPEPVHIPRVL